MAKLRFSEDECDDDLPVKVGLSRKRRRIACRVRIGGTGQPGMFSDEKDDRSCSSEGSDDYTDDSDDDRDDTEDENVKFVDDGHRQGIVEQVRDPGQGTSWGSEANRDASVSVILTDPEVLDCSICFESLSAPVFQVCRYFSCRAIEFSFCLFSVFDEIFVFGCVGICGLD